ncbi:hypothetical protein GCM10008119_35850 [Pedobacter mendelii]|uniref:HipA-like kinase domain-containing protein n=2 Tax=Pedobacter mendelii TaxID=1908240 RepID=A0ABQ2BLH4_9SPHI|nr:hypothetical protein GCM10008119_35850 [Pedobacter mendelii]
MHKGGSTKPWSITCIDASVSAPDEIPCVLKLFKEKHIVDSNSIGKEFLCNMLAREFDLVTPDAYLVDPFDVPFVSTLKPEINAELKTKHKGFTFCSRLVNASIVTPEIKSSVFDIDDCAMIFAFDCMIMNQDRGGYRKKSNLMMDDDGFILIDHELTFHFLDGDAQHGYNAVMEPYHNSSWFPIYLKHIFYAKLKEYRGTKKMLFDTFEEILSRLDISKVESLLKQLAIYDIYVGQNELLIQYLYTLKQNANKFSRILLNLIS